MRNVPYSRQRIAAAVARAWNDGKPKRKIADNPYGGSGADAEIAKILANLRIDNRLLRKIISY